MTIFLSKHLLKLIFNSGIFLYFVLPASAQVTISDLIPTYINGVSGSQGTAYYTNPATTISNTSITSLYGTSSEGVSARNKTATESDIRSISQSFTWNNTGALTGLGLLISGNSVFSYRTDQTWRLEIHRLSGKTNPAILSTIESLSFVIPAGKFTAEHYIYFTFTTPVALSSGVTYGFNLVPTSTVAGNEIRFVRAFNSTIGYGGQAAGLTVTYPAASTSSPDYNFYLTGSGTVLPVELASFTAQNLGGKNTIRWSTLSELHSNYFIIERSVDGEVFESIGKKTAAGKSNTRIDYSFDDLKFNAGTNYYRLKQVDNDGSYIYSEIRSVKNMLLAKSDLILSPNPVRSGAILTIQVQTEQHGLHATILGLDGKSYLQSTVKSVNGIAECAVQTSALPAGIYLVQFTTQAGSPVGSSKFVVFN